MDFTTIRHDVDDGILTVVLNRPANLNAFTVEMAAELERTFVSVNDDDSIRAVIVTGEGRAFCAGMDLSSEGNVFGLDGSKSPSLADMADPDDPELRRVRDTGGQVTLAIYACRKPVIAAINGAAVGIGATMTLAMDARLMSTTARFGLVFGKLGIVPEACSSWFLPRIVGMPTALDLVYRADILDAATAHGVGLAQAVYEPDELLTQARALADAWTRNRSPVSVALMRQMLYRNSAQPHPIEAHRVDSLAMFYTSIGDGDDGVRAFLEKRDPRFTGRASELPPFYDEWLRGG
ncbi:crotonase/enoyl-CoA hydratase family protein [Mycobacterium talmoniae]|uniref:Enoyl-CoA hydratase n=1 Tax=Mycobacterium talmoniae TaxID=1858794 RepID=A0A1S1NLM3_9MYCO|nr:MULTISPECIES: crotonase/enoyl-CoA hydratase family protein [Mycobacterium]OHV04969.1 enoyl-CoA hydratase [Mycobacterium talmoniae]PQM48339.1 Short-chain-enoyl-CoA hydratase [Mycobacterium talmoniae]TDH53106.1 enoyl-CoA hydratase [Mycobacterium eburneum]